MGLNAPLNTGSNVQLSTPERGNHSPSGQRTPPSRPSSRNRKQNLDPWCDDGSVSRVEPPWVRDKRLKQQRERLEQQKERLGKRITPTNSGSTNPFEDSPASSLPSLTEVPTNPFDSYTISNSDSSSSHRQFPYGQSEGRPVTPQTEEKKEPDQLTMRQAQQQFSNGTFDPVRYQVPPYQTTKAVNPFDSSVSSSDPSGEPPKRMINSPEHQLQRQLRPRIVRPSATRPLQKNPKMLSYADESVATDSLDQFLDTTDETAASSGKDLMSDEEEELQQNRLMNEVLQAAEALKQSFNRPSSRSQGTNSSGGGRHTPSTPVDYDTIDRPVILPNTPNQMWPRPGSSDTTPRSPTTPKTPMTPGASVRPATKRIDFTPSPRAARVTATRNDRNSSVPKTPEGFPTLASTKNQKDDFASKQQQESTENPSFDDSKSKGGPEVNLPLHDLCDEARTTDDLAWRNAIYLLATEPHLATQVEPECRMTALHVCCMALDVSQPSPEWMVRALVYTNPHQCQQEDSGGRLPLHLLAATSANVQLMQLLVEEYPASVAHTDSRGFTPLHLLLKNDQVSLTLEHLRILLGQSHKMSEELKKATISFRKGEHLTRSFQDLNEWQNQQQERHEQVFQEYPNDVAQALRKITQWKRRQINRGLRTTHEQAWAYKNPATIATPSGQHLPLHLLAKRKATTTPNRVGGPKFANHETLVRVLIAAHPQALLKRDLHGRTPLLVSLLQSDSLPTPEIVELLLGKCTAGFCSDPGRSPARLASDDNLQLPLHVAAEELADNFEILSTIAEAYPEAAQVQDIRGRTPLHCALQNYRRIPLDEATFALLLMSRNQNYEHISKTIDADGNRPLDLIIDNPKALKQWSRQDTEQEELMCAFLNASIDQPRNERQARDLLERIRTLPSWLRRSACASSHVQRTLLEELASPMNTALVLLQGGTLVSLLIVLRIALEGTGIDWDSWVLVNYFCVYHLATQILYWATACYLGEFYRMVFANPWRWIDITAVCCSIGVAYVVQSDITALRENGGVFSNFVPADDDHLIAALGAWATGLLWLSLVGYMAQWWCGMAVFVGSAVQVVRALFWPITLAAMGVVAMSQMLNTLEDCVEGNICGIEDAYTTVYWMILGEPILSIGDLSPFAQETTTSMLVLLIFFTLLWVMWLVSVIAITVSEASRLDRHKVALRWFWEPKVALTVTARPNIQESLDKPPTLAEQYNDSMERLWHVLSSSIRGGYQKKQDAYWYAFLFRPRVIFGTRILACIILPIWFWLGVATLGLLWPPQLRRWLFSTQIVRDGKPNNGPVEERLTAAKLSHLKGEMQEYQTKSMEQQYAMQQDLTQIKDMLLRAMLYEGPSTSNSF